MKAAPKISDEPWGRMIWLVDDRIAPGASMSLARMEVVPGRASLLHRHDNCSEAIHLLAGEIDEVIGDEVIAMVPGDTIFVPAGTAHQTRNRGRETAVMMLAYSSGRRDYEALSAIA